MLFKYPIVYLSDLLFSTKPNVVIRYISRDLYCCSKINLNKMNE